MLPEVADTTEVFKSTIWGPTCDSADCVYKDVMLPELRTGDWLMFPNAGREALRGGGERGGGDGSGPDGGKGKEEKEEEGGWVGGGGKFFYGLLWPF